jgi:LVIVD repeat-containing protein
MSLRVRTKIAFPLAIVLLLVGGLAMPGDASPDEARPRDDTGRSPALCGPDDVPEPGIQGDVPAGETANYNCGLTLRGQIPRAGVLQGAGHCAYVRSAGWIWVVDVSDPANPTEIGSVPAFGGSETMRAVVTDDRAVLVSGRGVYDIRDCESPVVLGEIQWPRLTLPGVPTGLLPHDIRINAAATKVYASFGMWEADIANLADPTSWTVTNHTCDVAAQYDEVHMRAAAIGVDLCSDLRTNPDGTVTFAATPLQGALLWPQMSHSPSTNADDTRLYLGDQAGGISGQLDPQPHLRVVDLTQDTPLLVAEAPGAGHSVDWFQTADGRQFVLHANEGGTGDTCQRRRPDSLGWAYDAVVTEVTRDRARRVSRLTLAINQPEHCQARQASGHNPWVSYHMVDDPTDATFAAVSFGTAGLRIFDIRHPRRPVEVAYFNHGPLVHAGVSHYDASRGLLYVPAGDGFQVLELQPQVRDHLGLDG